MKRDVVIVFKNRRVSRGCPTPLEIEKQKKKKGHQSKFKVILPIFCYFFSRKYYLLSYFLSCPPPEKLELKKKGLLDFGPPLRIPGHAPEECLHSFAVDLQTT